MTPPQAASMTETADVQLKPLAGVLVVALEQAVAAPYCSSRLADAGARVIKIERAGGDFARGYDRAVLGHSTYFVWLNRGKESLVLDIKDAEDALKLQQARVDMVALTEKAAKAAELADELSAIARREAAVPTVPRPLVPRVGRRRMWMNCSKNAAWIAPPEHRIPTGTA